MFDALMETIVMSYVHRIEAPDMSIVIFQPDTLSYFGHNV